MRNLLNPEFGVARGKKITVTETKYFLTLL